MKEFMEFGIGMFFISLTVRVWCLPNINIYNK